MTSNIDTWRALQLAQAISSSNQHDPGFSSIRRNDIFGMVRQFMVPRIHVGTRIMMRTASDGMRMVVEVKSVIELAGYIRR